MELRFFGPQNDTVPEVHGIFIEKLLKSPAQPKIKGRHQYRDSVGRVSLWKNWSEVHVVDNKWKSHQTPKAPPLPIIMVACSEMMSRIYINV